MFREKRNFFMMIIFRDPGIAARGHQLCSCSAYFPAIPLATPSEGLSSVIPGFNFQDRFYPYYAAGWFFVDAILTEEGTCET